MNPAGAGVTGGLAPAILMTGDEQQNPNTHTRVRRVGNGGATVNLGTPAGGSDTPSPPMGASDMRRNPNDAGDPLGGTASGLSAPHVGANAQTQGRTQNPGRQRPPRGCPQDKDHAPVFFNHKRDK
ncbi:hypothetical protein B0H13DRAFT_1866046 [Mycena leptocephala]|nr:hypothetical protein B0H13DRAFT_1866046 [Mycena leptocephala]